MLTHTKKKQKQATGPSFSVIVVASCGLDTGCIAFELCDDALADSPLSLDPHKDNKVLIKAFQAVMLMYEQWLCDDEDGGGGFMLLFMSSAASRFLT